MWVAAALLDGQSYPAWWPQFKTVRYLSPLVVIASVRSTLPITFALIFTSDSAEPRPRFRVDIAGDLVGHSDWSVTPWGTGTLVTHDQFAVLGSPRMERISPLMHQPFVLNHHLMARSGERGLRHYARSAWPHLS